MEMQRGGEASMKEVNPFDLYLISNEDTLVSGHYWNHQKFSPYYFFLHFQSLFQTLFFYASRGKEKSVIIPKSKKMGKNYTKKKNWKKES